MVEKKNGGLIDKLLQQMGPIIEDRITQLKGEFAAEFYKLNEKLDDIIELLEEDKGK